MISDTLLALVRCPDCHGVLAGTRDALVCQGCGRPYHSRSAEYLDLRPRVVRNRDDLLIYGNDGFTVGDFEDQDELEQLCQTYEAADEPGRNLIRMVAELSVAQER